jgi:hypothetical protein
MNRLLSMALALTFFIPVLGVQAAALAPDIARLALADMAKSLDAIPRAAQGDPAFLASYRLAPDDMSAFARIHKTVAFSYDNALAILAFSAAGDITRARRIADAFLIAQKRDRYYKDGRIRNAYRAGPVDQASGALVPGWWDEKAQSWLEDGYQVGTATGSIAFVGLAMAALGRASGDDRYSASALQIAQWIMANTKPSPAHSGFSGGYIGHDPNPQKITWVSTEHNIDIASLFQALGPRAPKDGLSIAQILVQKMVDRSSGRLFTGYKTDGQTINADLSTSDAMTLSLAANLLASEDGAKAFDAITRIHIVDGGVSFSGKRDALWIEGTAQWVVALTKHGQIDQATRTIQALMRDRDPDGYWRAIRGAQMQTGLSTGLNPDRANFTYLPYPHLAATAWVGLAALGANPMDMAP